MTTMDKEHGHPAGAGLPSSGPLRSGRPRASTAGTGCVPVNLGPPFFHETL